MKKPRPIAHAEIERFLEARDGYESMKETMKNLEKMHDEIEADMIARLDAGAKVDSREFAVVVDRSQSRRNVKWRDVIRDLWASLKRNPDAEEEKVKDATEPTVYPHVAIRRIT